MKRIVQCLAEQPVIRLFQQLVKVREIRGTIAAECTNWPYKPEAKYTLIQYVREKGNPCIHCHNSGKQWQILTEFRIKNGMSDLQTKLPNLTKICQSLQQLQRV